MRSAVMTRFGRASATRWPAILSRATNILWRLSLRFSRAPDRIVSCGRFEALLVLIADLKLDSPKMLTALKEIQRGLIRHDSSLVKDINIVVQELGSKA